MQVFFQEIDRLHSELTKLENASKLAKLVKEKICLNKLINEPAQKVFICGGFSSNSERDYACKLLEMAADVAREGQNTLTI
jgi:hypothetical protein